MPARPQAERTNRARADKVYTRASPRVGMYRGSTCGRPASQARAGPVQPVTQGLRAPALTSASISEGSVTLGSKGCTRWPLSAAMILRT